MTTRDRLLTATNELFRKQGFGGTSLKQVTLAAGAPMGSLYHHFPGGKDELAEAVLLTTGVTYLELFHSITAAAPDPATAITDFFDGAAEVLAETDFIDLCPIGTVAREVASTNERLRKASHEVFTTWLDGFQAWLGAAGLPTDQTADLAATVVAAIEGGFLLARTSRDPAVLRGIGRQVRRLVELSLADAPAAARS